MLLSSALQQAVQSRQFWTDYFWLTHAEFHAYEALGNHEIPLGPEERELLERDSLRVCRIDFLPGHSLGLVLEFDPSLAEFSLHLRQTDGTLTQLAWDDQAHWHPHALRWPELDLLCRLVALSDPSLPHPGVPLLLLYRFAPICKGDDVDVIDPLLEAAWHSLDCFSDREVRDLIERCDRRQAGFRWQHSEATGWTLTQSEEGRGDVGLYTLRSPDNADFPFQAWDQLLAEVQRLYRQASASACLGDRRTVEAVARRLVETNDLTGAPVLADALEEAGCCSPAIVNACRPPVVPARACWAVEFLLGLEPGTFSKRYFGPTRRQLRTRYRFDIDVPVLTPTFALPDRSGLPFADAVNRVLVEQDLGGAGVSGSASSRTNDGREVSASVSLSAHVWDDLERGIALIRAALVQAGAPPGTIIHLTAPERRTLPLYPDAQ